MRKLFLRSNKSSGFAKLYTDIRKNGLHLKVCTGIVVNVEEWRKAEKSATAMKRYEATEAGKKVHKQDLAVSQIIDNLFKEGRITSNEDRHIIESAISVVTDAESIEAQDIKKKALEKEQRNVFKFYTDFVEDISTGKKTSRSGNLYAANTIKGWKMLGYYFNKYLPANLTFEDIDEELAESFREKMKAGGCSKEYTNKIIALLKQLCRMAAGKGLNDNARSLRVWKRATVETDDKRAQIYLTDDEIDALYNMQISGREPERHAAIRDLFVLGCLTCQRFSDYSNIKEDDFFVIDGTEILVLKQKKTKTPVGIPVYDQRIKEICKRNNYNFPDYQHAWVCQIIKHLLRDLSLSVPSLCELYPTALTSQEKRVEERFSRLSETISKSGATRYSEFEKIVGEKNAVFYSHCLRYKNEIGNKSDKLYLRDSKGRVIQPKWQLVGTHTARRSGITNFVRSGVLDNRDIMKISGHKTEAVFKNYVRTSETEAALDLAKKMAPLYK